MSEAGLQLFAIVGSSNASLQETRTVAAGMAPLSEFGDWHAIAGAVPTFRACRDQPPSPSGSLTTVARLDGGAASFSDSSIAGPPRAG